MSDEALEVPLVGGLNAEGVVKIGDTVRRPLSASSGFVQALLEHFEAIGLSSVPRHLGVDAEGRHVLSYLEGSIASSWRDANWSDRQIQQAAHLLREFHDASSPSPLVGDQEVICHNDFGPWNVLFRDDSPVAIIDFDSAAPGPRIRDVSYAAWCWLVLGSESYSASQQARRLRVLTNAYGWTDMEGLLDEVEKRQIEVAAEHEAAGRLDRVQVCMNDRSWLQENRSRLQSALEQSGIAGLE